MRPFLWGNRMKTVNIAPLLLPDEYALIVQALSILASRDYHLSEQDGIFDKVVLSEKEYGRIRIEAGECVKLAEKLNNIYFEKLKRSQRR